MILALLLALTASAQSLPVQCDTDHSCSITTSTQVPTPPGTDITCHDPNGCLTAAPDRRAALARAPKPPAVLKDQFPPYLPAYLVTAGGGAVVLGHGAGFAYWSVSRYLGQQTYATAISEYAISKGQVLTCPLAGISKIIYALGPATLGMTGAGGACSGSRSGAESAASGQGFLAFHIKGAWSIIATARKTFTASGSDAFRLTLGVGWGQ